jgi:outer membrane protein OmpA-like peptidoglycan-associated protein
LPVQFPPLGHVRNPAEILTGPVQAGAGCATSPLRRPVAVGFVLACVLSLTLAGCGGTKKKQSTDTRTATTSTAAHAVPPPKPIATVQDTTIGSSGPVRFQVSIYDLRRDGPFLVLDLGLRCETPDPGCDISYAFATEFFPTTEVNLQTLGGIGLVDPANLKEYLVVRDSEGRPDASAPSSGGDITDSEVHLAWVRYPLPPAGTSSLDVVLPDGGTVIRDVPITSGSPPTPGGQFQAPQPGQFTQPPSSTSTAGLTLPVENLTATSGNPTGSDSESPGRAQLTLQSDVLFQFNKSNLTPKAQTILRSVARQIKARARGTVQVTGYTDSIGSDAVNIPLSQARARSVVGALTPLTSGVKYTSQGLGSADPVAPNTLPSGADNPAGRALNRRVTIAFSAAATRPTPPPNASAASTAAGGAGASMTFTTSNGGNDTYRASQPALYRDGNLLVLTMTLGCVAGKDNNTCDAQFWDMAGIPTVPPEPVLGGEPGSIASATQAAGTLSGFYLLDPSTGTEYIPVRRSDAVPLTTNLSQPIANGDAYAVWSYFPAPASTTTSLMLVSPTGKVRLGPIPVTGS